MQETRPDASALLSSVFGFDGFRPGQAEIVGAVAAGKNVLAIMPTGGGKSLCFQLPAIMRDGVTVVISPLIALMRDQVRGLREAGVEAGALTSGNTPEETDAVWQALEEGRLKLLYIAPERLASSGTDRMLKRAGVSLIAVDEAHCVSQWGHDFRPDYLRIGALRRALNVPLAAFTATADAETRDEIVTRLFDGEVPEVFLRGFDRPNLSLAFEVKNQPRQQILSYAAARRGQSGIVYCGTRAKTETLARALSDDGHSACAYHGGMEADDRRQVEHRFATEDGLIVVATVAFGMGVDKPDIRWVAQADLPKSIEAYYQEIGRAGRDGAPADTLTLYGPDDIRFRRTQIDEGLAPPERKSADHARLNALLGLAEAVSCRRQKLLVYFGEDAEPCGNCDLCAKPPETFDASTAVQKALSAILRTGEWFGTGHLVDILTGTETEKVRARGHERLPTFGVGTEFDRKGWQAVFRQMMGHDLVRPDPARHGALAPDRGRAPDPARRGGDHAPQGHDDHGRPPPRRQGAGVGGGRAASLRAEGQAPGAGRGRARAGLRDLHRPHADRDGRDTAAKPRRDRARLGRRRDQARTLRRGFPQVITGQAEALAHPARRKLAGREAGAIYDRLLSVQADLARGDTGLDKPLSCSSSQLAKLADLRPTDRETVEKLLGERRADRFAEAFLDVLRKAG
jgi:ATP-dependent DNA helicase RecQ